MSYMINAHAADRHKNLLEQINITYADGGIVSAIKPPKPPTPVEFIDVESIPDEACDWTEDNMWDSDVHSGYRCERCGDPSDCTFCEPDQPNVACARNRAESENFRRQQSYARAVQDYEAQWRYYREIVDTVVTSD